MQSLLVKSFASLRLMEPLSSLPGYEAPDLLAIADHITWCISGTTHELGRPQSALHNDQFRREYLASGSTPAGFGRPSFLLRTK